MSNVCVCKCVYNVNAFRFILSYYCHFVFLLLSLALQMHIAYSLYTMCALCNSNPFRRASSIERMHLTSWYNMCLPTHVHVYVSACESAMCASNNIKWVFVLHFPHPTPFPSLRSLLLFSHKVSTLTDRSLNVIGLTSYLNGIAHCTAAKIAKGTAHMCIKSTSFALFSAFYFDCVCQ